MATRLSRHSRETRLRSGWRAGFDEEKAAAPFDFAPLGFARGRLGEGCRTPKDGACGVRDAEKADPSSAEDASVGMTTRWPT
jgi:hypothetical protein